MAGNIKGITIEINGDTQPLQKALKDVSSESVKTSKELKEIDKSLKFDPANVTVLTQKQEVLQKQIGLTKNKLEILVKAQKNVEEEFQKGNIGAEEYRKFQREVENTKSILSAYEGKLEGVTQALSNNAEATEVSAQKLDNLQDKTEKLLTADVMMGMADKAGQIGQAMVDFGQKTLDAFSEVDSGLDIVTTKTGASGDALKEMQDIASDLAVTIPTDFETAGSAVGELNTQFGLTGDALRDASEYVIKFAEINGTDVTSATIAAKKAISAYGLEATDLNSVLDSVTATSQKTGVGVDDLMNKAVSGASQIKMLGLSFGEGVELMGQFEQAGVDSSGALSSLAKAAGVYAKDGKTLQQGLEETINTIKNSTNETDALNAAMEVFGAKAAPRMVDAIQRGTFSFTDLAQTAESSAGVVGATFDNTVDDIDKFTVAQNASKQVMAELGGEISTVLAPVLQSIADVLKEVVQWFGGLPAPMKQAAVLFGVVAAAVLTLTPVIAGLVFSAGALGTALSPFAIAIVAIIAAITGAILIFQNWGTVSEWLGGLWQTICDLGQSLWSSLCDFLANLWTTVVDSWNAMWSSIGEFLSGLWNSISSTASSVWNGIVQTISDLIQGFVDGASGIFNGFMSFLSGVWNGISSTASSVWNGISTTISNVVNAIGNVISSIWNSISSTTSSVWNGIKSAIGGAIDGAKNLVGNAIEAIKGFFSFKIQWPHIPLPHFSISGSANPLDWLKGGLPRIGIEWYAKGGIMTKPTIFGMNGNRAMIGGEAGNEAILPLNEKTLGAIGRGIAQTMNGASPEIHITIANPVVREEADIPKIANEVARRLAEEIQRKTQLRGGMA